MSEKASPSILTPLPYTDEQRRQLADAMLKIADEFDDHARQLRTSGAPLVTISATRAVAARAGRLVASAVKHGALTASLHLAPWLLWYLHPDKLPKFRGWRRERGLRFGGGPSTPTTLKYLLQTLAVDEDVVFGGSENWPPLDAHLEALHQRLVFFEAAAGWLGQRCTPEQQVRLPEVRVVVGDDCSEPTRNEELVPATIDWDIVTIDKLKLLHLELGAACGAVCRHLAAILSKGTPSMEQTGNPSTDVVRAWQQAAAEWRRHVVVVPATRGRPARAILNLRKLTPPPADGIAHESCEIETDPDPSALALLRLANDPGAELFERLAIALADASQKMAGPLEAAGIDSTRALELARSLRRNPRRPRADQEAIIGDVEIQVGRLDLLLRNPDPAPKATTKMVRSGTAVRPQRPRSEAIDATALSSLVEAMSAAQEAGEAYFPSREDLANAVSKALNYRISVASLFGTKQMGNGRQHRYPKFIALWQKAQKASKVARPSPNRPVAPGGSRQG